MSQVKADYFYQKPEVKKKTKKLCEEIQRRRNLAFGQSNVISYEIGRKYLKVGEVAPTFGGLLNTIAFVDMDGNIYKSASHDRAAKHKRGNIFSKEEGKESIDNTGYIKYLRG